MNQVWQPGVARVRYDIPSESFAILSLSIPHPNRHCTPAYSCEYFHTALGCCSASRRVRLCVHALPQSAWFPAVVSRSEVLAASGAHPSTCRAVVRQLGSSVDAAATDVQSAATVLRACIRTVSFRGEGTCWARHACVHQRGPPKVTFVTVSAASCRRCCRCGRCRVAGRVGKLFFESSSQCCGGTCCRCLTTVLMRAKRTRRPCPPSFVLGERQQRAWRVRTQPVTAPLNLAALGTRKGEQCPRPQPRVRVAVLTVAALLVVVLLH